MALKYKTTADIKVSKQIVNQVIGQEGAVEIIKKAAQQRRHVLLIGEPGTGKSMLGLALAELLPKEKLVDVLSYPNPNDENQPIIKTVHAGEGRNLVSRSRLQNIGLGGPNFLMIILLVVAMIVPWWARSYYNSDIMFAAFFLGGMIFLAAFVMFMSLGRRMGATKILLPKVIVDNFGKNQAPFFDATGSHAGALLGDVLHDPFQSLRSSDMIVVCDQKGGLNSNSLHWTLDNYWRKPYIHKETKEENNYEAVFLPNGELNVLGEKKGTVAPVEVLSANRYDHEGDMIKLTTSENKELIVTPEHKIAILKHGRIGYVEAKDLREGDEVFAQAENIIIDEQDIINTYDKKQQEQCGLYYQYLDIKEKNPSWGYKRIAKSMGHSYGKTRWWHAKKHIPVPIQTANWLKERRLLPLKIDNNKLPLIAKVLGATFGDGGIFENLNGIFLSSSEKKAVEEFGMDIEKTFCLNKEENYRIIEGGEYGHSWCYQNTNRKIIRFFLALGAPKGNKTNIELKIPNWIELNQDFEDEFYGSIFGGELGTPIIHKTGNYLTCLELGITGKRRFDANRYEFLNKISSYLIKKNIQCTSIYRRKLNDDSIIYRLQIGKKFDNVLYFMMNVKINYCKYKVERLYGALGQWAALKREKYYELIQRGCGAEYAMDLLKLTPDSLYLLLNHFGSQEAAT